MSEKCIVRIVTRKVIGQCFFLGSPVFLGSMFFSGDHPHPIPNNPAISPSMFDSPLCRGLGSFIPEELIQNSRVSKTSVAGANRSGVVNAEIFFSYV